MRRTPCACTLACAAATVLAATSPGAAAIPPVVTVTHLQPVDAPAPPDQDDAPGTPTASVYSEPVAYPTLPARVRVPGERRPRAS